MSEQLAYCMDCMEGMKQFPDKFFELAIVDPPYGIGDTFIGYSSGNVKGALERTHKKIEWDDSIPDENYFGELRRISQKRIIWGANYFNCFDDGGAVVWYKNRGGTTLSQCEIASVSGQKKIDYVPIQILTGFVSNENRIHPTQKPIALYEWLLTNYAKPGDKILDTHLGSGSSRIAAYNLGFDFVGYEIDRDYFDAQEKRFQEHISQVRFSDLKEEEQPEQTRLFGEAGT